MYTECPACNSVFRVTAKVLQQARGRVRCGGCGNAFSALDYLSEELPETTAAPDGLTGAFGDAPAPRRSATDNELLAKLDELAGSEEVLIEDTGTEWRVLDELLADVDAAPEEDGEPGAAGRLEAGAQAALELHDDTLESSSAWRFDDDTPHPDSVGDEDGREPTPRRRAEDRIEYQDALANNENQLDFILSDPGDWSELLDEVTDDDGNVDSEVQDIPLEVEEELAAIHSELSGKESASRVDIPLRFEVEAEAPLLDTALAVEESASRPALVGDDGHAAAAEVALDEADLREPDPEAHLPQLDDTFAAAPADEDGDDGLSPSSQHVRFFESNASGVESIIMEGESIQSAIEDAGAGSEAADEDQPQATTDGEDGEDSEKFDPVATLFGTEFGLNAIRGGRRSTDPPGYGLIAATVVCGLLLVGQVVHAYRDTLSTYGLFNHTLGPVYRFLGSPVTPVWNVQGWRFESTNGNVRGNGGTLTIVSRISNQDDAALPYPLVHVSLTDRWEEVIGSRVLSPAEYLAGDIDPGRPVAPGDEFTAVITVDDPSVDATGFKLNVCYREGSDRLRCATQDFKD